MKSWQNWVCAGLLCGLVSAANAVEDITVVALFTNKAVLTIDGERRVLAVGETSPEGVKLISADSEEAVLEVGGQRDSYPLGMQIGTRFTAPATQEVRIVADSSGMFRLSGSINGHFTNFLVDTGASTIAMNADHAKKLGIDFRFSGERGVVETASGRETAYFIKLKSVKVGEIELTDVGAVVVDGGYPSDVLLGMTFLGRLDMQRSGTLLTLKKKY